MKKILLSSILAIIGYANIQASEIQFKPATEFGSPGMIGTYYEDVHQATIQNPESSDDNFYQFTDVITGGIAIPSGLIKIGSYTHSPPARNGIKRMGVRLINVYGKLFNQDAIPGSSSQTYAPIIFTPSDEFASTGMIGNYFASNQIATIHNASSTSDQTDKLFTNMIATNNSEALEGLQYIGFCVEQPTETIMYLHGEEQMN